MKEIEEYKKRLNSELDGQINKHILSNVFYLSIILFTIGSPIIWIWISWSIAWKVAATSFILALASHLILKWVKDALSKQIDAYDDIKLLKYIKKNIIDEAPAKLKDWQLKYIDYCKNHLTNSCLFLGDEDFNNYIEHVPKNGRKSKFQQRLDELQRTP